MTAFRGGPASLGAVIRSPFGIALWAALLFLPFRGINGAAAMFAGVLLGLALISLFRKLKERSAGTEMTCTGRTTALLRETVSRGSSLFAPVVFVIFTCLPFMLPDYYVDVLIFAGIYAVLALGLNVIVGFAGLLNLGFAAFYAIGAYTYALLNTRAGLDFWLCLPLAGVFASLAGLFLAIPALRLKGDYLAIVTLGFGEIVRLVLNNWDSLTNGPNGITGIARPSLAGFTFTGLTAFYFVVFALVVISLVVIRRVKYSRIGRAWIAIRENEIAGSTVGINTTRYKLYAFTFGTFWAGIAGVLFASKMQFVSPESFTFMESVLILSMVILGRIGSAYGAVVGAFILVILPEVLRDLQLYRMLILGIGLVLLMVFRPQGLLGAPKDAYSQR